MSTVTLADLKPIARRAVMIALVVGPVLTLINQWEAVMALEIPHLPKMALTFLVPFCVSFFSGYSMRNSLTGQICATNALIAALRTEAEVCAHRAEAAENALAASRAGS